MAGIAGEMLAPSQAKPTYGTAGHRTQHRYHRYQALSDCVEILDAIRDSGRAWNVKEICEFMEWDATNGATRKRTRRIMQALIRIGKVENNRGAHLEGFYRAIK